MPPTVFGSSHVARPNDGEVTVVERQDGADPESFGERDHARVCAAEGQIVVLLDEFRHAGKVRRCELAKDEGAVYQRAQEACFDTAVGVLGE